MDPTTQAVHGNGRDDVAGVDLASLLLAIRRRWRFVLAGLVAGAVLGLGVHVALGPRFVATSAIRATADPGAGEEPVLNADVVAGEQDELVFELDSEALESQVQERVGAPVELSAKVPEESTLVLLRAQAADPEVAVSAADAAITLMVDRRRAEALADAQELARRLRGRAAELADAAQDLSNRISGLRPAAADSASAARLQRRMNILLDQQADFGRRATNVEIAAATSPIGLELVDGGAPVVEPAVPTRIDLVVLLSALGGLAALAALWAAEQRRGPLLTARGLGREAGCPVADAQSEAELEALALTLVDRSHGTRLAFGLVQVGAHEVALDEAIPLSRAIGALGCRVTLVDGDLRNGRTGAHPGLAAYLAGTATAQDVAYDTRIWPRLVVADAALHASPLQLARATSLGPLFAALGPDEDHAVVLALPDPVERFEAGPLLAETSGVVLQVASAPMRRREFDGLRRQLARVDVPVVGVVVMGARDGGGPGPAIVQRGRARPPREVHADADSGGRGRADAVAPPSHPPLDHGANGAAAWSAWASGTGSNAGTDG